MLRKRCPSVLFLLSQAEIPSFLQTGVPCKYNSVMTVYKHICGLIEIESIFLSKFFLNHIIHNFNLQTICKKNMYSIQSAYLDNMKGKTKKYHTVGKIVDRCKMDTLNTQIQDHSLFWLGTGISIESGSVKLVLWVQTSTLGEMMVSYKCFPHMNDWGLMFFINHAFA